MIRLPLAAVAAVALLTAGVAGAAIVPQKSIRGVSIGNTVRQVHAKLGTPDAVHYVNSEIMGRVRSERFGLTTVRYDGAKATANVIQIDTRSPKERVKGVGVGSTSAAVIRAVPAATCEYADGAGACTVGEFTPGARVTVFTLGSNGRVHDVSIGLVID